MTAYRRGYAKERDCRTRLLRDEGAQIVVRAAGSKGLVDLVAIYGGVVELVQVKYCAPKRAWKDKNWKQLAALAPTLAENVSVVAYIYRRGNREPEIFEVTR